MNLNIRKTAAIVAGKLLIMLSRLLGKQGTNLPGVIALKIYPQLLHELSGNTARDTLIVTGTNGKTTTANMLAAVIRQAGYKLVHNQAGANMISGITTAFIEATNMPGTRTHQYALLETDEANIPPLLSILQPRFILITNFFRDQLDRYGELDHTVNLIKTAVKSTNIKLVLNADDPLQSQFESETGLECHYYGLDDSEYDTITSTDSREGRYCVNCGCELDYTRFHYAQLGVFKCPNCGNHNREAHFLARSLNMTSAIHMTVNGLTITSPYQGLYNAYNVLAAVSLSLLAGFNQKTIQEAIAGFQPTAGRQEYFLINGKRIILMLVKNPTGLNQSLLTVAQDRTVKNLCIALNDNAADGRDVSWIWDADVETIAKPDGHINRFICSGQRSGDIAVRLKYAGVDPHLIVVQPGLKQAIHEAVQQESRTVYVLCTYTALFAARRILIKMHPERVDEQPSQSQPAAS